MPYTATLRGERFAFADLRELLAKASEEKSGDQLAGLAARSERERVAAKLALAEISLGEIADNPLLDPDSDEVSRALLADIDADAFRPFRSMSVGELREYLLDDRRTADDFRALRRALVPEVAGAVARLMSNKDLVLAASRIRVVTHCRNTMGQAGVFGVRVQPNHPADDVAGILL